MSARLAFAAPTLLQRGTQLVQARTILSPAPQRAAGRVHAATAKRPTRAHLTTGSAASGRDQTVSDKPDAKPDQRRPQVTLLYDGECPLCLREVKFLQTRASKRANALGFVDIARPEYDADAHAGITYVQAMGEMHGITHKGDVLTGVAVFRAAYQAVGLGWVYALTALPGIAAIADRVYAVWARRRLALTGRPPLADVLAARARGEKRTCAE